MFTPGVKQQQRIHGSRNHYERLENRPGPEDRLFATEREFISTRDSFYMASITETAGPTCNTVAGLPGSSTSWTISASPSPIFAAIGNMLAFPIS